MVRVAFFLLAAAAALLVACEPLEAPPPEAFPLARERMETGGEIPEEFGELVGVTTTAGYRESYAQLWFEDTEGTIRIVYVHIDDRRIDPSVDLIRRSRPAVEPETGEEQP
ncbi:MAG: hypothetical protein D6738_13855 [Acidobacteria bacterium]|nr:MAG: hypothetical protein D6738_13855 [Acidobacteriota bacterium]